MGCESVANVRDLDPRAVCKSMTVVGERLIYELRGVPCLDLEAVAPTRKGCAVTRMFSSRVEDLATLEQAIASHATRLGEKLRREGVGTDHVTVFFHTSEHDRGSPQRSVSTLVSLPEATNDSLALVEAAAWGVRRCWRDGYRYSKGGVITVNLVPLEGSQRALIGALDRESAARSWPPWTPATSVGAAAPWCRRWPGSRLAGSGRPSSRCARPATRRGWRKCP
jgi:DNA polymerase V